MTIEQYAYLGEIIAAIAVIASLFYVARQLGQTTTMLRINAIEERLERDYEILQPLIDNREVAEMHAKGAENFDSLDEVDKQRLICFEGRAIMLWHHGFQMQKLNLLPDANWQEQIWDMRYVGHRQSMRAAWHTLETSFEAPFREFVDSQFAIADNNPAAGQVGKES